MRIKNNKNVKLIGVTIILLLIIPIYYVSKYNTSSIQLDDVRIKEENRKRLAIMVKENDSEDYKSYEGSTWPEDYNFNKANCYDNTGNLASDVEVTYEDGKITVNTTKTVYCTLFFDKIVIPTVDELIETNSKGQIQDKPVEGDTLRRFQGSNDTVLNNYICFGTNDKDTCTSIDGQSKYMYRIMGIDVDTNELKIIKKEALDTAYKWHSTTGVTWNNSMLYKQLNGIDTGDSYSYPNNIFLTNETYVPNNYILGNSGSKWFDIIATHTWSYGDIATHNDTAANILKAEQMTWISGENSGTVRAKIGLIYFSDYPLAVSNGINCSSRGEYSECKASWIHLSNNDISIPYNSYGNEWTMTREGDLYAIFVHADGYTFDNTLYNTYAVRPVFYLTSQITLEGDGSIGDPYRIVNAAPIIEKVEVTSDSQDKFTVEVTASESVTKYCYKLDSEQEYKCTNSNTNEFIDVDANTNYTISVYVKNKNGLRSEESKTNRISPAKIVENTDHGNGDYNSTGVENDPLAKRFSGTDPNNYICFGADSCSNNDDHMYRIIGATSDGKLKIMKQTKLSSKQYWHSTTGATWEGAKLRSDINGELFYNNLTLVPSGYKQYIDPTPSWCIGDVQSYSTGSEALQKEMATCNAITTSPIGLMYLSDYYFAYDGTGSRNCFSSACSSWMTLGSDEWTMSRNSSNVAWYVLASGGVSSYYSMNDGAFAVRPVFYLVSNVKLSGSGSSTDPFIITGLA